MKLKAIEVAKINRGLNALNEKDLKVDDAWAVIDNKETIAATIRKYEEISTKVFKKYAVEGKIPVDNIDAYNADMEEAGAKEEEMNLKKLSISVLLDENDKINVSILSDLKPIIER